MFKCAGIIFAGLLLFGAGCTGVNQNPEPPPREWSLTGPAVSPPAPVKNPAAVKIIPAPPARPVPPPPKVAKLPPAAPILAWTSLDRWAQAHQLAAPRKLASSPVASYAVGSARGQMVLAIGSREATWNGVALHLGFAPEIIDDQVFVYGLDLQKNLEPLLLGERLGFARHGVIVLDPGHGGGNSGTISVRDGRPEKEFTLDWARRLKPRLEANGWTIFLTRTNDTDVSLSNRVAFAEARHADVFISLHFNSSATPDKKQNGLETYCLTPTGLPSTLTRGYSDRWTDRFPNNNFDAENLQLAVQLQAGLLRADGQEDRGVRRARFMGVLLGQQRPAVLIEGGYLSNPAEAAKIESAEFREKLAEAVANALK